MNLYKLGYRLWVLGWAIAVTAFALGFWNLALIAIKKFQDDPLHWLSPWDLVSLYILGSTIMLLSYPLYLTRGKLS